MTDPDGRADESWRPLVTVVLTCFNHQEFLHQALDAVRLQTYRPLQLIVTDDASSDGSACAIARWLDAYWTDAMFIRHEANVGLCRTLNEALALAVGELVTIGSCDDWMEPERIERLVSAFACAQDNVGLVYSGLRLVDRHGKELAMLHSEPGSLPSGWVFRRQITMPAIPTPTVMVRRSVYDVVGEFNEDDLVEDYDMWLRVCRSFEVMHVPAALVNFRWHDHNTTTRIQGAPYENYVAACLERQLGHSDETDFLIRRKLEELRG